MQPMRSSFVSGSIIASFDAVAFGPEYLGVCQGDDVLVNTSSQSEGWVIGALRNRIEPLCGWIPMSHFKIREFSLADILEVANIVPYLTHYPDPQPPYIYESLWHLSLTDKRIRPLILQHVADRREQLSSLRLQILMDQIPTLRADIEFFGRPSRLGNFPRWNAFRIERWWFWPESSRIQRGWHLEEVCWIDNLRELPALYRDLYHSGGLYQHEQLVITLWVWDYLSACWEPMDYV